MAGFNLYLVINVIRKDVAIKAHIIYTLKLNIGIFIVNGGVAFFLGYIRDCPI